MAQRVVVLACTFSMRCGCISERRSCRSSEFHSDRAEDCLACRLTRQVSAFYDEVLRCLGVFPLNQHFDRSWTAHVAVKSAMYEAESQMQAAAALHLEDDVHIEITRLKVCAAHLLALRC